MNSHVPVELRFRTQQPTARPAQERVNEPVRVVSSDDLFRGRHEIAVDHYGAIYRLRITRQGKLILNK